MYLNKTHNNSSGNVLFLILIAVALFAALSYAVTSSSRTSKSSASSETTLIASAEIVQYGSTLENAVTYLLVSKKCAAEEISFERAPFDGSDPLYVNTNAPNNFSCHIFHPNGGRAATLKPPKNANDGREWAYIETRVLGIGVDQTACGSECHEILIVLGGLRKSTCQKLNKRLSGSDIIPVQDNGQAYESKAFQGIFNVSSNTDIDQGAIGYNALCTQDAAGTYYYYHVLLPR
ncbi:MAG: hypothetical protein COA45_08430 [Zetaproteobacteria bacterium]|nr:MAG: hypothetical protein COA45_08430 [Zetaproteobacteria bacterium]